MNQPDPMTPSTAILQVGGPEYASNASGYYQLCRASDPNATPLVPNSLASGMYWMFGYLSETRYTHIMTPNLQNCELGGPWDGERGAITASSRHPGMVNVLMCDGSVMGIKNTIAPATWWALGTMAGREVISSDAY
jgi:prepilin-type processing-associated H-X9-DG protein